MAERIWSDEERAKAVHLAAEHGSVVAAEKTGVPEGTIRNWIHRGLAAVRPYLPAELADDARSWAEKRPALVEALGLVVVETLEAVRLAVAEGRLRDARDGSVTLGVLVDKAQLLAGFATARTEAAVLHGNAADLARVHDEIARLERELGYRTDEEGGADDAA